MGNSHLAHPQLGLPLSCTYASSGAVVFSSIREGLLVRRRLHWERWENGDKVWVLLVLLVVRFACAPFSPWRLSWLLTGHPTISIASNATNVEENSRLQT